MAELVNWLTNLLHELWPLRIVYSYQQGIRFWLGKDVKELPPGLYAFVPFFGAIETENVKPDVLRLDKQNVTTLDDVSVNLAVNVLYYITSARSAYIEIQDVRDNLGDLCRGHMAKRAREQEWPDFLKGQPELEKKCRESMTNVVKEYGIKILDVKIVSCARSRTFTLASL